MLYLNNVKNGGTEWKYQELKTEAVSGDLVIWPASLLKYSFSSSLPSNRSSFELNGGTQYDLELLTKLEKVFEDQLYS